MDRLVTVTLFVFLMLCLDSRCWLSQRRSFNWALTGPVVTVLGVSLWSRYSQPGVSNSNQPGTLLLPSFQLGSIQPPPPRYLNTNAVYCYCANSKYKYIFLFICILTICTMTKQKQWQKERGKLLLTSIVKGQMWELNGLQMALGPGVWDHCLWTSTRWSPSWLSYVFFLL